MDELTTCYSPPSKLRNLGFSDFPRPKTPRADSHPGCLSLLDRLHRMKVGIGDFPGLVVRMTHIVAKNRPLPADFTDSCHGQPSDLNLKIYVNIASVHFQAIFAILQAYTAFFHVFHRSLLIDPC